MQRLRAALVGSGSLSVQAVAERKKADDHVRFLLQELTHRSKNLISVIQAVATRTSKTSKSLADFQQSFEQRLHGLAVSNDLLIKESWDGAALPDLVRQQLAPFVDTTSPRCEVECPAVLLTAEATQAIGLALHELATNASKYGALSGPSGKVTVIGGIVSADPDKPLRICWIESGGPPVTQPSRRGFGTVVIDQMVSMSVNGRAEVTYDPAGFRWALSISHNHYKEIPDTLPVSDFGKPTAESSSAGPSTVEVF